MEGMVDAGATDRKLVAAFLADRTESSFHPIYRRHTPRMLSLGRRVAAGSPISAEDCVQEAWIRAVGALSRFGWRSSLASWLAGFVVNVAHEFRRAARPSAIAEIAGEEDAGSWPDPLVAIALADAVRGLPDGYRTVIALHDVGGFTHAEIAQILGIDAGTSKSQLARARARLRVALEGQETGEVE